MTRLRGDVPGERWAHWGDRGGCPLALIRAAVVALVLWVVAR